MTLRHVKPAEGRRVMNNETQKPLLPEGEWVTWNSYWQRRKNDGDLAPEAAAKTAAKSKTTKPKE